MSLDTFLGIDQLPSRARYYIRTFTLLSVLISFAMALSSTFYILFTIDHLGFALAGVTVSIMFFAQLVTDYPSGSLSDWIGQRWVLAISFACYGIAFFLLTTARSFTDFSIIALVNGLANAQNSGAIATWLDNNYKKVAGDVDPDRKIYGFGLARSGLFSNVAMALTFITGGMLATLFSRQFVFLLQSGLAVFLIILVLVVVKDEKIAHLEEADEIKKKSTAEYFKHVSGGIRFYFSTKAAFFFLTGSALFFASVTIWGSLILLPIYFGYTGSDSLASMLRTAIYVIGIPIGYYVANVSRRLAKDKLPLLQFMFVIPFFGCFFILLTFVPLNGNFNLAGIVITVVLMSTLVSFLLSVSDALRQRIMIDLIPSEFRNAVYSLIPTVISLFGIVLLPAAGVLIESFGIAAGVALALVVGTISSLFVYIGVHTLETRIEEPIITPPSREEVIPAAG
ncbi:MAG: MFS transporter [Candidatus Odinarchaeota archaeon]